MPEESGLQLALDLTGRFPRLKVLCMSGHSRGVTQRDDFEAAGFSLIQ